MTAENHEQFQKDDNVVVVAYLASSTDAPAPAFSALAQKHRDDYLFGLTTDKDVIEAAGVTPPAVVLYKKFDEGRADYKEKDLDNLGTFIKINSVPLIDEISGENYGKYAEAGLPLAYLFVDPTKKEQRETLVESIKPIASAHKGKVNFVWIDALKFNGHAKNVNLGEEKWPAFVIQDFDGASSKYPIDQKTEITPAVVEDWTKQFVAGKLEPKLKSESIPEKQDGPVFVLVTKQFDEVVFDDSKDVFVEFYAPWYAFISSHYFYFLLLTCNLRRCGHCKRLAPVWDQLGERYAGNEAVLTMYAQSVFPLVISCLIALHPQREDGCH